MNRLVSVTLWLVVFAFGTHAHAQSATTDSSAISKIFAESGGITTTAGVRLWGNEWDIPRFDVLQIPFSANFQDTVTTHLSAFEIGVTPFVGVRFGNVVASVSYFVQTDYDGRTPRLKDVSRDELDLTLGYSILPVSSDASLVISVGYKRANIEQTTTTSFGDQVDASLRINAALIGVNGNAPLTDHLRLYGNVAYGFARQRTETSILLPGSEVNDKLDGRYKVGEVGLSYLFFRGVEGQVVRSASIALGYRAQVYTIKSFSLFTRNSSLAVIDSENVISTPLLKVRF